jgi:hypothetical protein
MSAWFGRFRNFDSIVKYTYIHIYIYIGVYVCICVYMCVYMCLCVGYEIYTQTDQTHTHTDTNTHTHTHRAGEREETRRDETHRQVDILAQATGINNSHFVTSCHSVP